MASVARTARKLQLKKELALSNREIFAYCEDSRIEDNGASAEFVAKPSILHAFVLPSGHSSKAAQQVADALRTKCQSHLGSRGYSCFG